MNYTDIVNTALLYADRGDDDEVTSKVDSFLRIVEARINRVLQTRNQSKRAYLLTSSTADYYSLPSDFAGLRNIILKTEVNSISGTPMEYMTPEYLNAYIEAGNTGAYYTIISNSIQIPPVDDNQVLEVIYYQKIVPLTSTASENWLSSYSPDTYIQGLLVEISSFVKDADSAALWESRFKGSLDEISLEDAIDRWSGPPLSVRLF